MEIANQCSENSYRLGTQYGVSGKNSFAACVITFQMGDARWDQHLATERSFQMHSIDTSFLCFLCCIRPCKSLCLCVL